MCVGYIISNATRTILYSNITEVEAKWPVFIYYTKRSTTAPINRPGVNVTIYIYIYTLKEIKTICLIITDSIRKVSWIQSLDDTLLFH